MRRSSLVITIAFAITVAASAADAKLDLYVDKSSQNISVVQNGALLYVWPVSTGGDKFSTPNGVYMPERLERSWFSKAYYNAPMPHAIFFHNGYAIHGSYDIARLGGPASHGCIRLHPQDAAMLFAMVEQEGPANTRIVIGGDGLPIPEPRYRDPDDQFRSAYLGDRGMGRGAYPPGPQTSPSSQMSQHPQTSPYSQMSQRPQTSPYSQMSQQPQTAPYPQAAPYSQMSQYPEMSPYSQMSRYPEMSPYQQTAPYSQTSRRSQMSPYSQMSRYPQMSPYYDADRYMEAPGRRPGDNGQFAMRGVDPTSRPPAPRRDAASIEPTFGPPGGNRPPVSGVSAVNRPPAPRRDAASSEPTFGPPGGNRPPVSGMSAVNRSPAPRRDAAAVEPATGPRSSNRLQVINKLKCPACSANPAPEEPANQQVNSTETAKSSPTPAPAPSPPEQEQPSQGYKILPKSYWTGASWRWRSKSDQENH